MKRIRYTKFTGDLSSAFGLEDRMQARGGVRRLCEGADARLQLGFSQV
jgi:hypothetical protein